MKKAFTLVEILIVVSILGILVAVIIPEFRGHAQKAKESAAKETLQMLRTAIERYAIDHNGVPPGYQENDPTGPSSFFILQNQLITLYKYFSGFPKNPFNNDSRTLIILNNQELPAAATGENGWIYQPLNKDIRLDWPGTDSTGALYYDY